MRREIEIAIGRRPEDFDRMRELLMMLGFEPVRPVEKTRALFHLAWEGRDLELAVDSIDELGTFLEIEASGRRKRPRRGTRRHPAAGGAAGSEKSRAAVVSGPHAGARRQRIGRDK